MVDLLLKTITENPDCKMIISERSIFSAYHVFAKIQVDSFLMNTIEFQIYKSIYEQTLLITKIRQQKIIYLICPAEVCFDRIKRRRRIGESNIQLDYLKKCDRYHQNWLINDNQTTTVMKMNMNSNIEYDLNNKYNEGYQWIENIINFVTN